MNLKTLTCISLLLLPVVTVAQTNPLEGKVAIKIREQKLSRALQEIGHKAHFYFSYNSDIIKGDSIVTIESAGKTVRQTLDDLLGPRYEYTVSGRYIIITQKAQPPPTGHAYTISGWVVEAGTKRKISRASIYEADQLVSTLTDSNGFFRLRLKEKNLQTRITVSKELYQDTVLFVQEIQEQDVTLALNPASVAELAPFTVSSHVEKTWLGRLFLSSSQKIQSLNLLNFFADKPVQFSLTPGLGTHGQMGAQVINKFSFNLFGGYTAGSNGVEIAGFLNMDKKDVRYIQISGLVNIVGGKLSGVQIAGLQNNDLDSAKGLIAGGLNNMVHGSVKGCEIAGLINHTEGSVQGAQIAGLINNTHSGVKGIQIAGLLNNSGNVKGVQIAGILNRTRRLRGVQIGLINIADTSDGYMIGLLNITKNGHSRLSIAANEFTPVNVSYKLGNDKAYSIATAGANPFEGDRVFTLGYGLGISTRLSNALRLANEITVSYLYLGTWKSVPMVTRLHIGLLWECRRRFSVFTGPAISFYDDNWNQSTKGYKHDFKQYRFGWTLGINLF